MPTPITRKGHEALQAELDRLRKVERAKNIEAIAEARAHGDLSENAEYDAAKERQGFIESRIVELQSKLADARKMALDALKADPEAAKLFFTYADDLAIMSLLRDPDPSHVALIAQGNLDHLLALVAEDPLDGEFSVLRGEGR